ncbi:hypothetical protein BpHYR1_033797 [Brachionus plicatilis]|uniref:Uncharacterized protein n=1 Tax=Brachionus plicatilis TaxID=10195 RepID=A0A3M7Q8I2_BRAPC|nr:hypothetical protein BpHYR1_033797 [Brachionus plicatilis]
MYEFGKIAPHLKILQAFAVDETKFCMKFHNACEFIGMQMDLLSKIHICELSHQNRYIHQHMDMNRSFFDDQKHMREKCHNNWSLANDQLGELNSRNQFHRLDFR